ncbi:hypothetical protein MBLNU230_g0931t1 [Neophaeotheca triangularis]
MMASRVLSRYLPVAEGDISALEESRRESGVRGDVEAQRSGPPLHTFHDNDDDPDDFLYDPSNDPERASSPDLSSPEARPTSKGENVEGGHRLKSADEIAQQGIEENEDVPGSLLMDHTRPRAQRGFPPSRNEHSSRQAGTDAQWQATQLQQGLYTTRPLPKRDTSQFPQAHGPAFIAQRDPQADAMWLYTNASNLDAFLLEVYEYYVNHGLWSMILAKIINLLTELFVFTFATFLTTCIDYSKIPSSKSTTEVMIPKCMAKASWVTNIATFFFVIWWLYSLGKLAEGYQNWSRMRNFYEHVLGIKDSDIQTVSWVRVVEGLVRIRNANVATADLSSQTRRYMAKNYNKPQERFNAEIIANRLMRRANYDVAMYNKDILDFTLPVPLLGMRQFYSKSLEWSIEFCLTNFIFDEQGATRPYALETRNRAALVEALRRRLRIAAIASIVMAPFNVVRFCILYFFRYYTEFTRNPSRVSARTFTPLAEWKMREFNELDHVFQRRLRQAYPFANDYLKQFPKDKTDQLCRFIAFISGAIAAVLTLATLFDPELFLGFEVTPGRTAVFWLTVMIGIFGFAHGSLPDENEVHDPVLHLREVLMFTHYMPAHWKNRLHSNEVRIEFSALYQMKVMIFLEEILSLIVAPLILLRNANTRSERVVDFFREHTVHVDGVGYQCNFAVFGFKKDPYTEDPTAALREPDGLRDDYFGLKDDKMAASMQNFMQYYSHYQQRSGARRNQGFQPPPAFPNPLSSRPPSDSRILPNPQGRPSSSAKPGKSTLLSPRQHASQAPKLSPAQLSRQQRTLNPRPHGDSSGTKPLAEVGSPPTTHGVTESRMMAQDSDLKDFVDAPGKEQLESDTEGEDARDGVPGQEAGVLGMLYQFSKAKTEQGTGVHI